MSHSVTSRISFYHEHSWISTVLTHGTIEQGLRNYLWRDWGKKKIKNEKKNKKKNKKKQKKTKKNKKQKQKQKTSSSWQILFFPGRFYTHRNRKWGGKMMQNQFVSGGMHPFPKAGYWLGKKMFSRRNRTEWVAKNLSTRSMAICS